MWFIPRNASRRRICSQGQLSSAILEYETVLQRRPDDREVRAALKEIEHKAGSAAVQPMPETLTMASPTPAQIRRIPSQGASADRRGSGRWPQDIV